MYETASATRRDRVGVDYVVRWGDDFVRELKELGCAEIWIGAESGSQETLDLMHKDIRCEPIFRSVELCNKYDINVMMGFMWRWRHRFFSFPVDYLIPRFVLRNLRKIGLQSIAAGIYDE